MSEAIYLQLNQIFRDVLDNDDINLTADTTAADVQGWDSLAHINLMLAVERHFKVRFATTEIGSLSNVAELVSLLEAQI
ncbi:acyl carrier protein [Azoarcus sp. L1K30]|uniref:acyl carrier protein n=1 Tax=Azoarcus sp. L1K30 TaxID=2820277 RepID=UPI001B825BB1|nr:acyl carrier protein [Azoarcus sp. L1K30]MBR0566024.1 acyl carrier protein [Azoarcus sp. L1K30]